MAHTFANLLTHVIFSTKDRGPLIASDLKPDLLAYLEGHRPLVAGKSCRGWRRDWFLISAISEAEWT